MTPPSLWLLFQRILRSRGECSSTDIDSLAYAELYLTLAHLFRRFDLELYETSPEDMEWKDVTVPRMKGHLKLLVREAND